MSATDIIIVTVSVANAAQAETIATALLETRLAACVQQHPIASAYRWEGRVVRGAEIMLTIKTRAALFPAVREEVLRLHEYDVPEILALPVVDGLPAYLEWLAAETEG